MSRSQNLHYPSIPFRLSKHFTGTVPANEKGLNEEEKELLAIHSGTAEYDQMPVLRRLLGGVFHHHPEQCPVTVTPCAGHPLSARSAPFTLKEEQYFMTMNDPEVDVFVTTSSEHGEQPGAWRRVEGNGRKEM